MDQEDHQLQALQRVALEVDVHQLGVQAVDVLQWEALGQEVDVLPWVVLGLETVLRLLEGQQSPN